jgi:DNA-binding response OmpR family regulator
MAISLENIKFLIVDDNKHMRSLVRTILMALGAKSMKEAIDGADALMELQSFDADIVICDWNMSPLDGIDLVKLIRTGNDSANPYVSIIMLTGHTEKSRVIEARDAGVNEFLAKPISAKKLYSRIYSIIENPRKFIKTPTYFGPDRRRKDDPNYRGKERRKKNLALQEEDVKKLLDEKENVETEAKIEENVEDKISKEVAGVEIPDGMEEGAEQSQADIDALFD